MAVFADYGTQMTQMPSATQVFADFKNDFWGFFNAIFK
jgi:hypothetical protein